jgi:predicted nucleic acid-binding protein
MTIYWDTSALVRHFATGDLDKVAGVTRTHSLVELFSALTGRGYAVRIIKDGTVRQRKLSLAAAAKVVSKVRTKLNIVDLTTDEVLIVIQRADKAGAQGGRIHDLMHAAAAEKAKADELWTLDRNDFAGLGSVHVKQI